MKIDDRTISWVWRNNQDLRRLPLRSPVRTEASKLAIRQFFRENLRFSLTVALLRLAQMLDFASTLAQTR